LRADSAVVGSDCCESHLQTSLLVTCEIDWKFTHVAAMITAVEIYPVPARGEVCLGPKSETCHWRKAAEAWRVIFSQTYMLDGLLCKV
jgi:hypothetical protein